MKETTMEAPLWDSTSLLKKMLENDPAVIYVLDRNLRIVYCNESWDRFAAQNGGKGLERQHQMGRAVMDSVPMPLKRFFENGYRKVLSSRKMWEHCYECSSPAVYRSFRMACYPDPEGDGLVVVNSLSVERLHDDPDSNQPFSSGIAYLDRDGVTTMCCHCRKTCRVEQVAVWDWVPEYLENPPALISHGICPVCMSLLYPQFVEG